MSKKAKKNDDLVNIEPLIKAESDRNSHRCETLLEALQDVLEASKDSQFSKHLYRNEEWASYAFDYLNERLGLTDEEIILTAIVLEEGTDKWASLNDISKHLSCSKIEVMQRRPVMESLSDKGLVVIDGKNKYGFSDEVLKSFSRNEMYNGNTNSFDTDDGLYLELHRLHTLAYQQEISTRTLHQTVDKTMNCNAELPFAKRMAEYRKNMSEVEFRFFLCVTLGWLVNDGYSSIDEVEFIFFDSSSSRKLCNDLLGGNSRLIKDGLLECSGKESLALYKNYTLTDKAKMNICPARVYANAAAELKSKVMSVNTISKKTLFYNEATSQQVSDLASLLKEKKMQGILRRLKERNLRSGFTCLFHGAPGTGKTETVFQLAKMTGRDIYQVDYSQLRSKWIGESEKNVKAIFDEYRELCKNNSIKPILLLNEADALIGKRMENAERMSDKSENTMQNIVLQEMEKFDGILIATTNLAGNMDTAFERRFLYKIEFEKPDTEARTKIWRSMLPSLNKKEAATLSEKFPRFAGGQIENITRKVTVDEVLHGGKRKLSDIVSLCERETLGNRTGIGFQMR